jgi:hypothetical protein
VTKRAGQDVENTLLSKLRAKGKTSATRQLAEIVIDQRLELPFSELFEAERSAEVLYELLCAWQQSDLAHESIRTGWDDLTAWLATQHQPLGEVLPQELLDGAGELAAQPFGLNRDLLLAMLDRPAFRKLIRELLVETLISFGKKLRNPVADSRLGKGLSGIGRMARGRSGGVRSLAGDLVGAVSDEVERQLEGRAADFADGALSQILQRLADYLCEPSRSSDQAALRSALLEGLWELSGAQLAAEMTRGDVDTSIDVLRRSIGAWLNRSESKEELQRWLNELMSNGQFVNLSELLQNLGLLQTVRIHAIDETERNLRVLVESEAFEPWLESVLSG